MNENDKPVSLRVARLIKPANDAMDRYVNAQAELARRLAETLHEDNDVHLRFLAEHLEEIDDQTHFPAALAVLRRYPIARNMELIERCVEIAEEGKVDWHGVSPSVKGRSLAELREIYRYDDLFAEMMATIFAVIGFDRFSMMHAALIDHMLGVDGMKAWDDAWDAVYAKRGWRRRFATFTVEIGYATDEEYELLAKAIEDGIALALESFKTAFVVGVLEEE